MKNKTIILFCGFIIFFSIANAQTNIEFAFDENHNLTPNPIVYQASGVSQETLYNRALKWVSQTYISPDDVIVSNIKNEFLKIYALQPEIIGVSILPYNIELEFKEGRYRLTYSSSMIISPPTLYNEQLIPEAKKKEFRQNKTDYNNKAFEFLDSLFDSINLELTKKSKDKW
jgi:hypothetical protein